MFSGAISGFKARSWPRLQLIYFLIAACNIVATICGLYLGYQVVDAFNNSVLYNSRYEDSREKIEAVLFQAVTAQAGLVDGVIKKNAATAAQSFITPLENFREANISLIFQPNGKSDPELVARASHLQLNIDTAFQVMSEKARMAATFVEKGDIGAAQLQLVAINAIYAELRKDTTELMTMLDKQRHFISGSTQELVGTLQHYQLLVGLVMALIICIGAYYGYVLGQLLKKKFTELEKTHNDLAESHEQALAFSREIQLVNQDMGKLNRQLHDNLSALREAQDEALRKGKMAQLGNLTATVAHELRNPLSTVRTSTFLLARKIKNKGLGVESQIQRINNGIVRCDNIISQLLDFSRSKPVSLEPIELDSWLEKLVSQDVQRLPEIVTVECFFGLKKRMVDIEPGRLERAIINLLSNASEALLGKGDDPKSRYTDTPTIRIETRLTARGAEILVSDNGPGISPEHLSKIREPLFTTKNFGTGLGIPAVEQILEQHNGGMEITSEVGHGATFTLWLPIHAATKNQAA